ncbi:response regulator transcription factor [Caulobacter segnis]|uniref:response regulator transcription factor n=1 Tax=Caulobacter segnis TaxID=88688 RepID=UPI00240F09D6|nr:response regulator transcription factor [Caulobacter segnis]MDG2520470.1 response regulator transcription factor [Caulobacter segnis]
MTGAPANETSPARILIIDDDRAFGDLLAEYFSAARQQPDLATTSAQALAKLAQGQDIVILDLNLGPEDGLELLRRIRSRSDLPVIITTGRRCEEIDRVLGLELGADDYVLKPFGLRELLARVVAVLRRRRAPTAVRQPNRITFGPFELDRLTRTLHCEDADPALLSLGEQALLLAFLRAPGKVLSREHLLRATRVNEDVFDRSIDVQVLRLRRKLEAGARGGALITTVRGAGYVFDLSALPSAAQAHKEPARSAA